MICWGSHIRVYTKVGCMGGLILKLTNPKSEIHIIMWNGLFNLNMKTVFDFNIIYLPGFSFLKNHFWPFLSLFAVHNSLNIHESSSINIHATLKYCHCHGQSVDMWTRSVACISRELRLFSKGMSQCHKGCLHYVMSLGDMPHENVYISYNMHATDLVYISKYCHCHWETIDMCLACILREQ